jgi:cell division protein FtsB
MKKQLMAQRSQILEQYVQLSSEMDVLSVRRKALKKRAALLMDDLRAVTQQINAIPPEPTESEKKSE